MIQVQPTVLEGRGIRLEPLAEAHHDALVAAASDGRLWELWYAAVPAPEGMAIASTFTHLAHHRGQLTVYLRLNDAKVPSVYGPSADDRVF